MTKTNTGTSPKMSSSFTRMRKPQKRPKPPKPKLSRKEGRLIQGKNEYNDAQCTYLVQNCGHGTLQDSEEILVPYFEKMQKKWPKIWYSFIILMKYRTHLLIHLYV